MSTEEETIALKISSFVEAQEINIDLTVDEKNSDPSFLDVEISQNVKREGRVFDDLMDNEPLKNSLQGHDEKSSKNDRKCHVDNHATDHNYACSGFPMRKASPIKPEVNNCSTVNGSKSIGSPKKALMPELKQENEKKISNGTQMSSSRKRRLSCEKDSNNKEKVLPKRYRGPYCEDGSKGYSSSDEDLHYNRSHSRQHSGSDEDSDHERMQRDRKYSRYSDEEKNYYKRPSRRHSLNSNESSDERYSSSDEESNNERRHRYDPRSSESDFHHKHSSGSNRDSDSYRNHRGRKQRSQSKDHLKKRSDEKKNKTVQEIELERKMGFKFDDGIRGTAKVQFCGRFLLTQQSRFATLTAFNVLYKM